MKTADKKVTNLPAMILPSDWNDKVSRSGPGAFDSREWKLTNEIVVSSLQERILEKIVVIKITHSNERVNIILCNNISEKVISYITKADSYIIIQVRQWTVWVNKNELITVSLQKHFFYLKRSIRDVKLNFVNYDKPTKRPTKHPTYRRT